MAQGLAQPVPVEPGQVGVVVRAAQGGAAIDLVERPRAGRDPDRVLVLLAHQSRAAEEAEQYGVDLMLSGHNHGGQIWPWMYFVGIQQPYVYGLHRRGKTTIYVSEGTGFWGPPMRLGTSNEITLITLQAPP